MTPVPNLAQLVESVEGSVAGDLARVGAAVVVADGLASLGDQVVTHFVEAARRSGCSWSQIGSQIGVSKQAAQQAFVAPAPRRSRFGRRPQAERPFARWTDDARAALEAAQHESAALGHKHIGTEHLLLGVAQGAGLAARALERLGVDADAVRRHIVDSMGRGADTAPGDRPFTPRAKKILELAVRESARLHHDHVGTEHLLLALVREGKGLAAEILATKLGGDPAEVGRTVVDLLSQGGSPRIPGGPPSG